MSEALQFRLLWLQFLFFRSNQTAPRQLECARLVGGFRVSFRPRFSEGEVCRIVVALGLIAPLHYTDATSGQQSIATASLGMSRVLVRCRLSG
jgi:hypothetical protein